MLYHYNTITIDRRIWRYIAGIAIILCTSQLLYAQENEEEKSYTAPRSQHEWVFLGNTETSRWEYDQRTLLRTDSMHVRVRLKETPLKECYYDVRGAKMWDHRSIQGYSDTLRLHPEFYYEGYERYGCTILEENINIGSGSYAILYAADYDTGWLMIAVWNNGFDVVKPIAEASPESMLASLLSKEQNHTW